MNLNYSKSPGTSHIPGPRTVPCLNHSSKDSGKDMKFPEGTALKDSSDACAHG